jgi:hypothetical protein
MKSLQETLNENLVKGTNRLHLGDQELFDSPQVSHEDIKMALQQVSYLYDRLKQIDRDLDKCEKKGIASATLSDPKNFKSTLREGDRMRATMFGKDWDCTVVAFAWDEDRDACIPVGQSDDNQVVIPQLKKMWYKID